MASRGSRGRRDLSDGAPEDGPSHLVSDQPATVKARRIDVASSRECSLDPDPAPARNRDSTSRSSSAAGLTEDAATFEDSDAEDPSAGECHNHADAECKATSPTLSAPSGSLDEAPVASPPVVPATLKAPECPICMSFLCDPITLGCSHHFCRICLLKATRLSPDGRSCPLCRAVINIKSPITSPVNSVLEEEVKSAIRAVCDGSDEIYTMQLSVNQVSLDKFIVDANTKLPIFAMHPGTYVGAPVALHFFEPRYKLLIRRAWEGNRKFIFCGCLPEEGAPGVVVHLQDAEFLPDGRANIFGFGIHEVTLGETWVEEGTGGLYHSKVESLNLDELSIPTMPQLGSLRREQDCAIM